MKKMMKVGRLEASSCHTFDSKETPKHELTRLLLIYRGAFRAPCWTDIKVLRYTRSIFRATDFRLHLNSQLGFQLCLVIKLLCLYS